MPTQQDELYAAEETTDHGRTFANLKEVQRWVDSLRDESWWEQRYWMVERVEVGTSRKWHESVGWFEKEPHSRSGAGRMEMAHTHRDELSMIHELAHVLANARHGSNSHDPFFARTYLELTYLIRGSDAYLELQNAFDLAGIDYGQ
jgi:putative metallohydrolase (TIGR04338 family)